MTVVAGLVAADGTVWMAADSRTTSAAGTYHWPTPYPKVLRVRVRQGRAGTWRDVLLATSGSTALAQAVRHRMEVPSLPQQPERLSSRLVGRSSGGTRRATDDEMAQASADWELALDGWALEVCERVGQLALDRGMCTGTDGGDGDGRVPDVEGGLLAWSGRLWCFGPWQAFRCARGYETIGSGADHATGALWLQLEQGRADPGDVVRLAVEAACAHDYGCAPPVAVTSLPPTGL